MRNPEDKVRESVRSDRPFIGIRPDIKHRQKGHSSDARREQRSQKLSTPQVEITAADDSSLNCKMDCPRPEPAAKRIGNVFATLMVLAAIEGIAFVVLRAIFNSPTFGNGFLDYLFGIPLILVGIYIVLPLFFGVKYTWPMWYLTRSGKSEHEYELGDLGWIFFYGVSQYVLVLFFADRYSSAYGPWAFLLGSLLCSVGIFALGTLVVTLGQAHYETRFSLEVATEKERALRDAAFERKAAAEREQREQQEGALKRQGEALKREEIERTRVLFEQAKATLPLREDALLDLELFGAVEKLFGTINWGFLRGAPRFKRLIPSSLTHIHYRVRFRQSLTDVYFQRPAIKSFYSAASFERDCEVLCHPEHPYFIADEEGNVVGRLQEQTESLRWLLELLGRSAEILELRRVHGINVPRAMSDRELIGVLRSFLFADRDDSRRVLDDFGKQIREAASAIHRLQTLVNDAKRRLKLSYQKQCIEIGEFLSPDLFEDAMNRFASASSESSTERIEKSVQAWIEIHAMRWGVQKKYWELENQGRDLPQEELDRFVDERMAFDLPLEEVRHATDFMSARIERLLQQQKIVPIQVRREAELRKRESIFAQYDATISDPQQLEMAKEQYDNRVYLPAFEQLAKEESGNVHEYATN